MTIQKLSPFLDPTIMFDIEELKKMSDETLINYMKSFGYKFNGFDRENVSISNGFEKKIIKNIITY